MGFSPETHLGSGNINTLLWPDMEVLFPPTGNRIASQKNYHEAGTSKRSQDQPVLLVSLSAANLKTVEMY